MNNTERRRRGYRLKQGLEELGDLDAAPLPPPRAPPHSSPPPQQQGDDEGMDSKEEVQRNFVAAPSETPFAADWSDWRAVKSAFFPPAGSSSFGTPSAEAATRRALSVVACWTAATRAAAKTAVPRYIEATVVLIEAQLVDTTTSVSYPDSNTPTATAGGCSSSLFAVQSAYSNAISRAVHIMTGHLATSRSFIREMTTYRQRAKTISFPPEAIEIRQQIAHGATVPTLTSLRWVAGLVLQHLYSTYWLAQDAVVDQLVEQSQTEERRRQKKQNKKRSRDGEGSRTLKKGATGEDNSLEAMQRLLDTIDSSSDEEEEELDETVSSSTLHPLIPTGWTFL